VRVEFFHGKDTSVQLRRVVSATAIAGVLASLSLLASGPPLAAASPTVSSPTVTSAFGPSDSVLVMGPSVPAGDIATGTSGWYFSAGGPIGGPAVVDTSEEGYLTVSTTPSPGVSASVRIPFPRTVGTQHATITLKRGEAACSTYGAVTTYIASPQTGDAPLQFAADVVGGCTLFHLMSTGRLRPTVAAVRVNVPDHPVALPAAEPAMISMGGTAGDPAQQTVTVRNNGAAPWSISDTGTGAVSGTPRFQVDADSDTCTGATLAPGGTCRLTVRATAPASYITEHLVVRGDAIAPVVVPIRFEGHEEIATPTDVRAASSRANSWVGWTAAATTPKVGYRVYDVTEEERVLLGEAPPDATSLVVPPSTGRTVSVVAANSRLSESRDVTTRVLPSGSYDLLVNGGAFFPGMLVSGPDGPARPIDNHAHYRLNPTRDTWLARWGPRLYTCPVRTELCSLSLDVGAVPPGPDTLMEAEWLPDGRIVLLRGLDAATRTLWAVRADGSGLTKLTSAAKLEQITPTASGTEIVGYDPSLWSLSKVRLSDGKRTAIPNTFMTDDFTITTQGKLVVSGAQGVPSNGSVTRVMNLDGTGAKTLSLPSGLNRFVTFDPAATRVAWVRYTADREATVWTANADGSQARRLDVPVEAWQNLVWSVPDRAIPVATLTGPAVSTRQVTLTVGASDPDSAIGSLKRQCRLDGATTWTSCGASWSLSGLAAGKHTAYARVIDPVGHVSAQRAWTWLVDASAPTATLQAPSATQLAATLRLQWASSDTGGAGVASHDVRVRKAPLGGGFGSYTYPSSLQKVASTSATVSIAQGSQYCFSVRARDKAGNVGAWSAQRCTAVALDDTKLAASSGWVRARSSAYAFGTYTTIARTGATLSRASVQGKRISVIATTCPTCGALDVYHAGRKLGRISLYSTTTRTRQERYLPTQTVTRTGTVTLKTVSGKRVHVDGIVVRH
jgi:hypothetical protein